MATAAYYAWVNAGRPNNGLVRPLQALAIRLRNYGYTVYAMGNQQHLEHDPPEDHTCFSATGWPIASPRWWLHAIDIMPPPAGIPSLQQLGAQMVADRHANHPGMVWLKYINWEPQRNNGGDCWHDSWQPGYSRRTSTDRGHIHMSARSDMTDYSGADSYDPVARIRGGTDMDPNGRDIHPDLPNKQVFRDLWDWAVGDRNPAHPAKDSSRFAFPVPREEVLADLRLARAEAATLRAAVAAMAAQITAGGGNVDTAAVLTRINQIAAETVARETAAQQLHADSAQAVADVLDKP